MLMIMALLLQLLFISQTDAYILTPLRIPSPAHKSHAASSGSRAFSTKRRSTALFQFKNFDEMLEQVELPILVDFYGTYNYLFTVLPYYINLMHIVHPPSRASDWQPSGVARAR